LFLEFFSIVDCLVVLLLHDLFFLSNMVDLLLTHCIIFYQNIDQIFESYHGIFIFYQLLDPRVLLVFSLAKDPCFPKHLAN
jgi:hypothetical protein